MAKSPPNELSSKAVKKPNLKERFTDQQIIDLMQCQDDPIHFIHHFMKVQHAKLGSIPFLPYDYQKRMINGFLQNRFSILLASRQLGKCVTSETNVLVDGRTVPIGSLIPLTFRQRVIKLLEGWLVRLAPRKFASLLIKYALWCLDADHRTVKTIADDDTKKFTHIIEGSFKSDFGIANRAFRTIPYPAWELTTPTKRLVAADRHRVIREDGSCAWLEDLREGDKLQTSTGIEEVVSCRDLKINTHMYCLEVETSDPGDPRNHLYYTDGILSHNTTAAAGYLLWKAMFEPDVTILITANNYSQALEIMDRVRYAYENLPDHLRAGATEYNKGTIRFDNGSKIVSRATTPNAGRGLSISLLYCDEMAALPPKMSRAFWTSIRPTLATGGSCIITSTPQSDEDQFSEIWRNANDNQDEYGNLRNGGLGNNEFFPILVTWEEHPDRDERWAAIERAALGEAKFRQEHQCEFVSSDETLVSSLTLIRLKPKEPIYYTGTVRWYAEPQPNRQYLIGLDPSLGTGGDDAAIQVFQLPEMLQIGEWQNNNTAPRGQMRILMQTLIHIDEVLRAHELQAGDPEIYWTVENNTLGEAMLQIIEDTGEERFPGTMISERRRRGTSRRFRKGLNTTPANKRSACARLKSLVETGRLIPQSSNLIRQFKNFVASGNSFAAKQGEKDDLVSAALLITRMLDIVLHWAPEDSDLREHIGEDELGEMGDEYAMPMVV